MKRSKEVKKLSLFIIGAFLVTVILNNILNRCAWMLTGGGELTILYIMIQWTMPCIIFVILNKEGSSVGEIGFRKKKIVIQILIGIIIGIMMALVVYVVPSLISGSDIFSYKFQFHFGNAIYYLCGVAVNEEILFRGYIYKKLMDITKSTVFAVAISSLAFGLFHILGLNIKQMVTAAIFGAVLCLCKYKFKHCSLLSLILAHGIYGILGTQMFELM